MSAENKVPAIRFEGFSGEWDRKEFGHNLVSVQTGTNLLGSLNNDGSPLIKMGNIQRGYFSFDKVEYLNASVEVEKENIANFGDFLFNTRNTLELVGKGATWMGNSGEFAFNNNIARFKFDGVETVFFNYLYNTQNMIKQVQARAMGTTSVAAIYPQNLKSIEYFLPNIKEQTKIGDYFQQLDTLIAQHQQKHEKLLNIKKALLEKCFPQQGCTEPAIRFKGFSVEWEEKALGGYSEITTGKLDANAMKADGDYDFYTSGIKKYKIDVTAFEGPAITIAGNGATVGYMHLADGQFNAYQRTYVLSSFTADRYFLYFHIGNVLPLKISQEARTGNIPYIVLDMLTDLEIMLPHESTEQTKIGQLFQQLDTLISQHQAQLKKLANIKQACLEKMFV